MRFLTIILLVTMYACTSSSAGDIKGKSSSASNNSRKVLVELFTSQGCSSCPSADKLVSSLAETDTNLIVLSFHVDYWDRLGWKDAFSNHDYALRQQQYVQALHAESVYTPQAVVQGKYEMVGSNKTGLANAFAKVREQNDDVNLTATAILNDNHTIDLDYDVNKISPNQQIMAAVVQTHASTAIQRGENAGIQLSGYNIVRAFSTKLLINKTGTVQLSLPADISRNNASVVVFIQDIKSKEVMAVTNVKL